MFYGLHAWSTQSSGSDVMSNLQVGQLSLTSFGLIIFVNNEYSK